MTDTIVYTVKQYITTLGYVSAINKIAIINYNGISKVHSIIFTLSYDKSSEPFEKIYSFGGVEIFESHLQIYELFEALDKLVQCNSQNPEINTPVIQGLDLPEKYRWEIGNYNINLVGNFIDKGIFYGSNDDAYVKLPSRTSVWIFAYSLNTNYVAQSWPEIDFSRSRPPYENVQDCINAHLGLKFSTYSNSPICNVILPINKARIDCCEILDKEVKVSISCSKNFKPKSLFVNIMYEKGRERERDFKDISVKDKEITFQTKFQPESVTAFLIDEDLQLDRIAKSPLRDQNMKSISGTNVQESRSDATKNFTIFVSHSIKDLQLAKEIKEILELFGLNVFLAHQDIVPASDFDKVLLEKLQSSVIFMPLLTRNFQESEWTGQEIGIAVTSKSIILPIKFDIDPYGFIKNKQAVPFDNNDLYSSMGKLMSAIIVNLPQYQRSIIRRTVIQNLVKYDKCYSFDIARVHMMIISGLQDISEQEMNQIASAIIENVQIHDSFSASHYIRSILEQNKNKLAARFHRNKIISEYLS